MTELMLGWVKRVDLPPPPHPLPVCALFSMDIYFLFENLLKRVNWKKNPVTKAKANYRITHNCIYPILCQFPFAYAFL